jgi:hypothetical protein
MTRYQKKALLAKARTYELIAYDMTVHALHGDVDKDWAWV